MTRSYSHTIIRTLAGGLLGLTLTAPFMASCSTTKAIPEDEQLYTGIQSIDYADNPTLLRLQGKQEGASDYAERQRMAE